MTLMQVVVFIFQDQKCLQHAITVIAPSLLACNLADLVIRVVWQSGTQPWVVSLFGRTKARDMRHA